jgi:exonuclease III
MNTSLRIISYNCKNIKTCVPVLHKLFIKNDVILIQEHWLLQAQIHLIGELHSQINYAAKEVDINDPLLPISMPRGYGGVAVIWKNEIDHLVWPIQDGSEKIQAVEIQGKAGERLILISVYLPAKGSKNHQIEYQDCVDQLYELYQKYMDSHTIVIGGDMNEDLNNPISNKRNQYLLDFIRETQLAYNNSSKTFVNSMGQEASEIDYFCITSKKKNT